MVLTFVPLFFTVSTYARYSATQRAQASAQALGRAVAAPLLALDDDALKRAVQELGASDRVAAALVTGPAGRELASAGDAALLSAIQVELSQSARDFAPLTSSRGPMFMVRSSRAERSVTVALPADQAFGAGPLVRLLALYMAVVAAGLLLFAYFAVTYLIVRPLGQLSAAAERIASGGARRFQVPRGAIGELSELGQSVRIMTERLMDEEAALRRKIDEVERARAELAQAHERLVRSERLASVGRLAAGLAHEIGNPISALMGLQDLLLEGELTPAEQRDFLQRMRKETERIHRILRDLLQFARPAASALAGVAEPGDINVAASDTAALLAPQKALHDVKLELALPPELPPVQLSREHLMQVLLNLLMNAADACGPGGRVTLRAAPAGPSSVRIEVEDTGPGVAPEVAARLFEPFVTTKEVGKGTGLGLAVCRGLVEAAGGTITLDERFREGARFVIELPVFGS